MKNILVTGNRGFIGKNLIKLLKKNNYRVFEFSQNNNDDILDEKSFHRFKNIDTVFHLAAVVGYQKVIKNLSLAYKVNVLGTINVLNFCFKKGAKLFFPSTFIYGPPFNKRKKETDLLQPTNFYTHTKYMAEIFCQAYVQKYKLKVVISRNSNAYGPYQPKDYIIPFLIKSLKTQKEITLTHSQAERDFIYIDDLLEAWLKIAQIKTKPGEIFNVCSGKSTCLKDLVILLKKITGSKTKVKFSQKLRKNEVLQSRMDNSKIKNKTGWKPKISLDEGLKKIVHLQKNLL